MSGRQKIMTQPIVRAPSSGSDTASLGKRRRLRHYCTTLFACAFLPMIGQIVPAPRCAAVGARLTRLCDRVAADAAGRVIRGARRISPAFGPGCGPRPAVGGIVSGGGGRSREALAAPGRMGYERWAAARLQRGQGGRWRISTLDELSRQPGRPHGRGAHFSSCRPHPTHAGCSLPTWQGEYRGLVDMTLENIEDVVNEMCDEVPGFDSTLAVRAPSPHPPRHARTLTLLRAPAVARRVAVGVARTECSASTWGISARLC